LRKQNLVKSKAERNGGNQTNWMKPVASMRKMLSMQAVARSAAAWAPSCSAQLTAMLARTCLPQSHVLTLRCPCSSTLRIGRGPLTDSKSKYESRHYSNISEN